MATSNQVINIDCFGFAPERVILFGAALGASRILGAQVDDVGLVVAVAELLFVGGMGHVRQVVVVVLLADRAVFAFTPGFRHQLNYTSLTILSAEIYSLFCSFSW